MVNPNHKTSRMGVVIHGGAGSLGVSQLSLEKMNAYKQGLLDALQSAYAVLQGGGSSHSAVLAAVVSLEDHELFNAGRGSVLTNTGTVEMDAALMLGKDRRLGCVMGCSWMKNPILLADKILAYGVHHCLCGEGADAFGAEHGLPLMPPSYFRTAARSEQLLVAQERQRILLDHSNDDDEQDDQDDDGDPRQLQGEGGKMGTVGAVACDSAGNLAAATSTGGVSNKAPGRIGDSPIIGAGTFADNRSCAVSATGKGELFIQHMIAAEIHYRRLFLGESLRAATAFAVHQILPPGSGGVIAIDQQAEVAMTFNTPMMFRGYVDGDGRMQTLILPE